VSLPHAEAMNTTLAGKAIAPQTWPTPGVMVSAGVWNVARSPGRCRRVEQKNPGGVTQIPRASLLLLTVTSIQKSDGWADNLTAVWCGFSGVRGVSKAQFSGAKVCQPRRCLGSTTRADPEFEISAVHGIVAECGHCGALRSHRPMTAPHVTARPSGPGPRSGYRTMPQATDPTQL
jgi:hypothetical protein